MHNKSNKYYHHHYYYYYYYYFYYYPSISRYSNIHSIHFFAFFFITIMSGRLASITFLHIASSRLPDSGENVSITVKETKGAKNHGGTAAVFCSLAFLLLWLFSHRVTHRGPGTYYISHSMVLSQSSFTLTGVARRPFAVKYLFREAKIA